MHMTATLTKWYEERGRHEIFAGGKSVNMASKDHSLVLKDEIVTNETQKDLDVIGVAKTAREEKMRSRDARLAAVKSEEDARMMALYKKHVLRQPEGENLVQIGLGAKPKVEKNEEVGALGD
jgi:hypothetical protein